MANACVLDLNIICEDRKALRCAENEVRIADVIKIIEELISFNIFQRFSGIDFGWCLQHL